MDVRELREQRKRLVDAQRVVLEKAVTEKRALTGDERQQVEAIDTDIDALKTTIDLAERVGAESRAYVPETQRPAETAAADQQQAAYRDAFWAAMRGRAGSAEHRVMAVGTDTSGGYTVPDDFRREIVMALEEENIMRRYATVFTTTSGILTLPTLTTHASASWLAENAAYSDATPTFSEVTLNAYKASMLMKVSEELLNDSAFPLQTFVAGELGRGIGKLEEAAFVNGTGSGQPSGFLLGSTLGKTATATNAVTADELVDLYHALPRPYRARAIWILKDSSVQAVRKLVTGVSGDKTYLWQPGLANGEPDMLLGRPVVTSLNMPAIATGNKAIAFGEFRYYYIADRQSITVQRLQELYAANGQVGFRLFKRTDGKVALAEAIQHLKLA